jgi:methyl-accepting chemotaxis protein
MVVVAGTARVRTMDTSKAKDAVKQYFDQWGLYQNIGLYGLDGAALYRTDGNTFSIAGQPSLQRAIQDTPSISGPLRSAATGQMVLVVAAPVEVDNKVAGVVSGEIPLSTLEGLLQLARLGSTGDVYLIDRNRAVLTVSRMGRGLQLADEAKAATVTVESFGAQQVGTNTFGVSEYSVTYHAAGSPDSRREVVGAYHSLARISWGLLAEQDQAEAFAATTVLRNITLAVVTPIRDMTQVAQALAGGDAGQTVTFQSRDEVGWLAAAFRDMLVYLQRMTQAANQIADGDLTVSVAPASEKDILGHAFERMIQQVRETVGQVAENAAGVGAAAKRLTEAADLAGQATAQQTAAATRTAASMDEMKRAIDGVALGAQEQSAAVARATTVTAQITAAITKVASYTQSVAQESTGAARAAREGAQVVAETAHGMESLKAKVGVSSAKVQEMGKRSSEIGVIVETIEDIASQTNLLALNAAIEAARAGEQGAGFAVVAGEVRKLSERAAAATREISGLVRGIQQTAAEATAAMAMGTQEVEQDAGRAIEAGHVLESILTAAEAVKQEAEAAYQATQAMSRLSNDLATATQVVNEVVEQNTAATEEMAAGAGEVARAIETIARVGDDMNTQTLEVTSSAAGLEEMAQALLAAIALFQIGGAGRDLAVSDETAAGALLAGTGFIYRRDFVREQYREAGWQKVLTRLAPDAHRLISGALVPTAKYPQALYAELISAIKAEYGGADPGGLAQQMARYVAKAEARGVYRAIMTANTPEGILGQLPALWRAQAGGGEMRVTPTGRRAVTLVLDHEVDAELCQSSLVGYMEGLLELVGVEHPMVKHTACLHRGGANCRYEVSW